MTIDLTTLTPAEIDERWQKALIPAERLRLRLEATQRRIREYEHRYTGQSRFKPGAWEEREYREARERVGQERVDYQNEFAVADGPFSAEWERRGGWSRYYLVPGGKLHDYYCHTLTPGKTLVGLLTEASGLTREEVVERYQVGACTHCFPDAPVEVKRTPAEEGFCEYSGVSLYDPQLHKQLTHLQRRYPKGWHTFASARSVKCHCGGYPSLTSTDKLRKHKPGKPEL